MSELPGGLPVPVLDHPHWRVNFTPEEYVEEAVPSLEECLKIVESNRVRLRGWDYPHLSHSGNIGRCTNYVASWTDFIGHCEYWRFYQSTQFIHLFAVREVTEIEWREKLRQSAADNIIARRIDWSRVPGFFSITNFIYCVTEIMEFAARLSQAEVYKGTLRVSIELKGIKDFLLTTEPDRVFVNFCPAPVDVLGKTWAISCRDLVAESAAHALESVVWFFESFGWSNPPREDLLKEIDDFLRARR